MKKKIDSLMKNAAVFICLGIGTLIFVAFNYNVSFTQQKYLVICGTSITLIGLLFRVLADRMLNKKINFAGLDFQKRYEAKRFLLKHGKLHWYLEKNSSKTFRAFVAYPEDMINPGMNKYLPTNEVYVKKLLGENNITNPQEVKRLLTNTQNLTVV